MSHITLSPDECRILGVLVEKSLTTPQQYPLSLNALTLGCNQKNNRHPVIEWDEDRVYDGLDKLRNRGLVREANLTGSRVAKFRHVAREGLHVDTAQLVLLTELLLRGPQSLGELRQNAGRMHTFDSLETVRTVAESLKTGAPPERAEPLIKEVPPPPGSRARLYVQLLCENLHPIQAGPGSDMSEGASSAGPSMTGMPSSSVRLEALEARVAQLEAAIAELKAQRP